MKYRDKIKLQQKRQKSKKFHRHFLLIMLLLAALAFLWIVRFFFVPVIVAGTLVSLFYPFYKWLLRKLRNKKSISAFICCIILFLGLILPIIGVGNMVVMQAIELYKDSQQKIQNIIEKGDEGLIGDVKESKFMKWLRLHDIDWLKFSQQSLQQIGSGAAYVINKASKGIFAFVTRILIIFFTMFYFFRDGPQLVEKLKSISPMEENYEQAVIDKFGQISKATVNGTLLVGLAQGSVGGVTLLLLGIETWLLWGVVMVILSIVPLLGPYLVMIPAGLIQLAFGNIFKGIVILIIGTVVVGSVDNVIRPRVVGKSARMHDLIIFFATLGGIAVFGALGFIVGPLIAAVFLTILDIYTIEFKGELNLPEEKSL